MERGVRYNHDLNVSEEFLACYPAIRDLLRDERLLAAFRALDTEAKRNKRRFERWGFLALVFGTFPLLMASIRAMFDDAGFAQFTPYAPWFEACGVISVLCILWVRRAGYRANWCWAIFARERLRQWHFQLFLDGRLIELHATNRAAFDLETGRRWSTLCESFDYGFGTLSRFVHAASRDGDFLHEQTRYQHESLAASVCDALAILRIAHQLSYSRRKVEPEGGEVLKERTEVSEQVAAAALGAAVGVIALAFFVSLAHLSLLGMHVAWVNEGTVRVLGGLGLLLAVVSAASRAYRAGFTLPDELESYEEYCDRLREIEVVFRRCARPEEKLRQLELLEEESAAELRRFLRMKLRATFVI